MERNRALYGANQIPRSQPKAFLAHLLETFEDDTIRVLVFSAVVSLVFGFLFSPPESQRADIIQALAIVLAVVVVSGVNSYQNWSKDTEFQSLTALTQERLVTVQREGTSCQVSMYALVVGDVVKLASGDSLPCDGVMLSGPGLLIDESSTTGESQAVEYQPCLLGPSGAAPAGADFPCMLKGPAPIKEGEGFMLVSAVGCGSALGKMKSLIENAEMEETPLQERLDEMAGQIGKIGMAAGVLTASTLLLLRIVAAYSAAPPATPFVMDVIKYFIMGVAIVVVAVPEGLPLAVTIALAFSMRKMMRDQCMVKRMKACETMGSATFICSDKTGTLTENRMTVEVVLHGGLHFEAPFAGRPVSRDVAFCNRMREAIFLNSSADPYATDAKGKKVGLGNPTEIALIHFAEASVLRGQAQPSLAAVKSNPDYTRLFKRPFSKEDKFQASVYWKKHAEGVAGGEVLVFVLGAPEVVVGWSTAFAPVPDFGGEGGGGSARSGGSGSGKFNKSDVQDSVAGFQDNGMRVVALACRVLATGVPCPARSAEGTYAPSAFGAASWEEAIKRNLHLLGLFCIADPLRPTVKRAIAQCQRSGINVMMMTGDHVKTARAIAQACNIIPSHGAGGGGGGGGGAAAGGSSASSGGASSGGGEAEPRQALALPEERLQYYKDGKLVSIRSLADGPEDLACMTGEDFRLLCADTRAGGEDLSMGAEEEEEEEEGEGEGEAGKAGKPKAAFMPSAKQFVSSLALKVAPYVRVLARCKPADKHLMVTALQRLGEVVAVTGDGTNDAPALKKADVGLAMGIAGTDVAKEAADIIILDDDFRSIVAAVRWGRSIKANIRKFLAFQLTINIVALTLTFFSACTSGGRNELPLKPVQLLWVNLIMDSFAALALATEPPSDNLLNERPSKRDAPLITQPMWVNMVGHAVYQIAILLYLTQVPSSALLFGLKESDLGNTHHDTVIFTTFVALQVRRGSG